MDDIILAELANDTTSEKSITDELLYLGAVGCEIFTEIEGLLLASTRNDSRLKFLISLKNRWACRFNDLVPVQYDQQRIR